MKVAPRKRRLRRWGILAAVVIVISLGVWKWRQAPEEPLVRAAAETERLVSGNRIMGLIEDNGSYAWLGIPYAEPPVGALRWRAPQATRNRGTTFQAVQAGSFCSQLGNPSVDVDGSLIGEPVGSEDCLYLNIWSPPLTPETLESGIQLPVMFWIHGGGNSIGHGANYNGKSLAIAHNLVVVTINYRLGPLGWFSHPALHSDEATEEDRSGNFGTLDIIQAMRWVHDNIAAFGGDPEKVTIFGESAGAFNTLSMMLSPKAKGLFHRAIIQSGGIRLSSPEHARNYMDMQVPGHRFSSREVVNRLLIADERASNREEARTLQQNMTVTEMEQYLRSKSPAELLNTYETFGFGMLSFPNLFRDGTVLPTEDPWELLADRGRYNAVPVVIGSNRDEYKLFMAFDPQYVDSYLNMIFRVKDKAEYAAVAGYLSDAWKAVGVDRIAARLSESQEESVYAYRFDWDEEPTILGTDLSFLLGAAHMLEIPFVFKDRTIVDSFDKIFTDENEAGWRFLSDRISSYWAEFAYTGSPGTGRNRDLTAWKPWTTDDGSYIILDTRNDQGIMMTSRKTGMQELKARLIAETDIKAQKRHCRLYVMLFGDPSQLFSDTRLWSFAEFRDLGKEGCGDYSPEDFFR